MVTTMFKIYKTRKKKTLKKTTKNINGVLHKEAGLSINETI